ncbi:efflux RND transporter periplasmic adaptor subunit [Paenalcaligenes sp. Me131]|uniref:efflux RND transporter periplasmic adaptor subunit n=1 Tax=Paenalcaligenes sp. Me131 TaxID=3392636 RepID=UPI003D28B119
MSNAMSLLKPVGKVLLTLSVVAVAVWLVMALWQAYVLAPWTRDGRVSAQVVRIAPEVSGTVVEVPVADDQYVKHGDVLYRIDPARFELAVAEAEAHLAGATLALQQKMDDAKRRQGMDGLVSREEVQRSKQAVAIAQAEQQRLQVVLETAKLNLDRATLRAPVDGYVTRLRLNQGDYVVAGQPSMAVVDANSFWMTGYFEETKLPNIAVGATAQIRLMGVEGELLGHVVSIGRGIADSNQHSDAQGLPSVEPSFSWVRLAQRIPVRVEFDHVPESVLLAAGMTGSIAVAEEGVDTSKQGRLSALLQGWM